MYAGVVGGGCSGESGGSSADDGDIHGDGVHWWSSRFFRVKRCELGVWSWMSVMFLWKWWCMILMMCCVQNPPWQRPIPARHRYFIAEMVCAPSGLDSALMISRSLMCSQRQMIWPQRLSCWSNVSCVFCGSSMNRW